MENPTKKNRKTILATAGISILALMVAGASFILVGGIREGKRAYEAERSEEDREKTEQLLSKLDQIDMSNPGADDGDEKQDFEDVLTEEEKQIILDELARIEDEERQALLKTLSAEYSAVFAEQKSMSFAMVENLIEQGKADWKALVAQKQNTAVNKGKLASEYLGKASALEKQLDADFEALISRMEQQLVDAGIDSKSIVAGYRAEYKKIKDENRSAMMKKAMEALKR